MANIKFKGLILRLCLALLILGFILPTVSGIASAETQTDTSNEAANSPTDQIRNGVFGDRLDDDGDPGYLERQLASLVVNFADFIRKTLGLKDFNELIFLQGTENLVFNTFESSIFSVIVDFFNSFLTVSAWLAVFSLFVWAFMIMFKGGTQQGQISITNMAQGLVIYFVGLNMAGYMYKLLFDINYMVVLWAIDGMKMATGWDVMQVNILEILTSETKSLGQAALVILIVFCVGMLNYQYALRLVTLIFLMVIFPWVLFRCTTPGAQKVLDDWFREFAAQIFTQAGHAIGYAIFISLLAKTPNFFILLVFLVGMPTITSLIRLPIGAHGGGTVSGGFGMGTVMAVQGIVRGLKGNGGGKSNTTSSDTKGILPSGSGGASPAMATAGSYGISPVSAPSFGSMMGSSNLAPVAPTKGALAKNAPGGAANKVSSGMRGGPSSSGTSTTTQASSPIKSYVDSKGGTMGLMQSAAIASTKAAGKVAKQTARVAGASAGFIAGSALSGNLSGGFVGAALGAQAVGKIEQGVGTLAKGAREAGRAFQSYRSEKPITETQLASAPLALPMGSGPIMALPAGPGVQPGGGNSRPAELPGPVHTPLAEQGGVMVSSKPGYPGHSSVSIPSQSLSKQAGSVAGKQGQTVQARPLQRPSGPMNHPSTIVPPNMRSPIGQQATQNQRNRNNMNYLERQFHQGRPNYNQSGSKPESPSQGVSLTQAPPPLSAPGHNGDPGPIPPPAMDQSYGFSDPRENSKPKQVIIDIPPSVRKNE